MAQSNICIRIDDKLKQQFDALCSEFGLTMTSALNMFIKTVIRESRIPFEIKSYYPNEETRKVLDDIDKGIGLVGPFDNIDDLRKALEAEDDGEE